jgi:protein tyrosine/serine phosphatase
MSPATRVRSAAVAVAIALSLSVSAGAKSRGVDGIRIDNFARVSATYYRGAQPVGSDYADLKRLGVKTVINLIGDEDLDSREPRNVEAQGMRYIYIPMSTRRAPTQTQVEQFLSIVNDAASQPVYVHCVGGRHRTGVMTAVYRMTHDGISGDAAFREMKQFNYGPDFLHPEFKKFVYTYQPKTAVAVAATQQQ